MSDLFHLSLDEGQRNYLHMLLDDARADTGDEEVVRVELRNMLHSAAPTLTATTLSDEAHAANIRSLAHQLQEAVVRAADLGLDVDIDAQSVSYQSLGNSKSVPIWRIEVKTARPL